MKKLLSRLAPWAFPSPAAPPPQPVTLKEAVLGEGEANARRAAIMAKGTEMPAADFISLAMPVEAFNTVVALADGQPVRFFAATDFAHPQDHRDNGQPSHDRYVATMTDGELSVVHQRQCMWVMTPHPEDAEFRYPQPRFAELSRLTGVIEGDKAYVALQVLAHPYGAVAVAPAEPQHMRYYRELQQMAADHARDPVSTTPPPLPSAEEREAMRQRVDDMVAMARRDARALGL